MHFYGRASDVPPALCGLRSDDSEVRDSALAALRHSLEHQDSVIQATPVTVSFLLGTLATDSDRECEQLLDLLRKILLSADLQLECHGLPRVEASLAAVLSPERLLPPLVDKAIDDAWLEENPVTVEDLQLWALVSIQELLKGREILTQLAVRGSPKAASLLYELDLVSTRIRSAPN